MPVALPTLDGKTHRDVVVAFDRLKRSLEDLEARHAALLEQVQGMPAPLTLQDIAKGLSSSGSAPLDLTGLIGKPAAVP